MKKERLTLKLAFLALIFVLAGCAKDATEPRQYAPLQELSTDTDLKALAKGDSIVMRQVNLDALMLLHEGGITDEEQHLLASAMGFATEQEMLRVTQRQVQLYAKLDERYGFEQYADTYLASEFANATRSREVTTKRADLCYSEGVACAVEAYGAALVAYGGCFALIPTGWGAAICYSGVTLIYAAQSYQCTIDQQKCYEAQKESPQRDPLRNQ